jgi:hypothetical protein
MQKEKLKVGLKVRRKDYKTGMFITVTAIGEKHFLGKLSTTKEEYSFSKYGGEWLEMY